MPSFPRDSNRVAVIGGVSSADLTTPVSIAVDPTTHRMKVDLSGGSSGITIGTTTITSGTGGRVLYDNAGVVGEMTTTGSGTVLALATSPVFVTPTLGAATATTLGVGAITSTGLLSVTLAGAAALLVNSTDSASLNILTLKGTRATPAANDEIYQSLNLNSSTGVTREFARITAIGTTVTNTAEVGNLKFSLMTAGTLTGTLNLTTAALTPVTTAALTLGTTALMWSDLYLKTAGTINWNNGNVTITQASNQLTFGNIANGAFFGGGVYPSVTATYPLGSINFMWTGLYASSGAVINFNSGDVTVTHSADKLTFNGAASGYIFDNFISTVTDRLTIGTGIQNNGNSYFDSNGNSALVITATASAVNYIRLTNAATGTTGAMLAAEGETNVDLRLAAKGTGKIAMQSSVNFADKNAYFTQHANGNTSTAQTIDWTLSNKQTSTLTGNCTFTFTAPNGPCSLVLRLAQDGSGSRTATWPATVHWSGGTAPTLTTTLNKIDIITFYYDGTTFFGNYSLNYTA